MRRVVLALALAGCAKGPAPGVDAEAADAVVDLAQDAVAANVAWDAALPDVAEDAGAPDAPVDLPPDVAARLAKLSIAPASALFVAPVGSTSQAQPFTVTNTGEATSGPIAVRIEGTNAMQFVIVDSGCTAPLEPGARCTLNAAFTPLGTSCTPVATLVADAGAASGGTATAELRGFLSCDYLVITPMMQAFSARVGGTSQAVVFTLKNIGDRRIGPFEVGIDGANASQFAITEDRCSASAIDANAICTVSIVFKPTTTGTKYADVALRAVPGGTITASLFGTATP
jgi:hypothetical protein